MKTKDALERIRARHAREQAIEHAREQAIDGVISAARATVEYWKTNGRMVVAIDLLRERLKVLDAATSHEEP